MDKSIFMLTISLLFLVAVAVGGQSYEMQELEEKESEIEQLKEEMAKLKQDIQSVVDEKALTRTGNFGQGQIAFTAGVSTPVLNHLGSHHTIVFDKVITRIGNAYSPSTGIFTAPLNGAYVFTLTIMVNPRHQQYLEIVVDGVWISDILADAASLNNHISTTKQWVLKLTAGSRVWIRTEKNPKPMQLAGNLHTVFSGFLLYSY